MASQGSLLLLVSFALLAAGCSSNVVGMGVGTGMGGAGGATTSTGTGGSTSTGTCPGLPPGAQGGGCHTDADCGGGTCAPITPGGYRACLSVEPEATSCNMPAFGQNACCTSADCANGKCYSTASLPACGGPAPEIDNQCFSDQCTTDAACVKGADLPPSLCAPAGFDGSPTRACFTAYCHTDADCSAQPCGACVPVVGPCCNAPLGLGCVYPGGCTKSSDCPSQSVCTLDPMTGTGSCTTHVAPCPV